MWEGRFHHMMGDKDLEKLDESKEAFNRLKKYKQQGMECCLMCKFPLEKQFEDSKVANYCFRCHGNSFEIDVTKAKGYKEFRKSYNKEQKEIFGEHAILI